MYMYIYIYIITYIYIYLTEIDPVFQKRKTNGGQTT